MNNALPTLELESEADNEALSRQIAAFLAASPLVAVPRAELEELRACAARLDAALRELDAAQRDAAYARDNRSFPAPGLWVVEDTPGCRSERLIARVADLPDPMPLETVGALWPLEWRDAGARA